MSLRIRFTIILLVLAVVSTVVVNWLADDNNLYTHATAHHPDFYMENFSTLTMKPNGSPKNRLYADYMAHYDDDDTTELTRPRLEIFKPEKPPLTLTADKGWVTSDNKVILLGGRVDLWQDDHEGVRELEVNTSEVRVLLDQDYAETDQHATIKRTNTIVDADGVRAYFRKNRIELLDNVRGKIEPGNSG